MVGDKNQGKEGTIVMKAMIKNTFISSMLHFRFFSSWCITVMECSLDDNMKRELMCGSFICWNTGASSPTLEYEPLT